MNAESMTRVFAELSSTPLIADAALRLRIAEFARYLDKRAADSKYTFREHLRKISGAAEE